MNMNRVFHYLCLSEIALSLFLLPSCAKQEETWRDYGDFYSFDEGFYYDGLEYHERLYLFRNGMMLPWFSMTICSSVIKIHYHSYRLSSSPWEGGKDAYIGFYLVADSLLYEPGKHWEMRTKSEGENCGEVVFSGSYNGEDFLTGYNGWDIKGWISFIIGEHDSTEYYKVKDCRFEFEINGPNGELLPVTNGYKRHRGDENVAL